jgi:hypothetical protein
MEQRNTSISRRDPVRADASVDRGSTIVEAEEKEFSGRDSVFHGNADNVARRVLCATAAYREYGPAPHA